MRLTLIMRSFIAAGLLVAAAGRLQLVAAAPAAVIFPVTSTLDVVDDAPGDSQCHTLVNSPAAGACTLRAAVMEANLASGAGATISLSAGIYTLIIPADLTDTANTGDLNLTTPVSGNPVINLTGAGAGRTIIDANGIDRVLLVHTDRTANISGVTLRGGHAATGGGILNHGTLTLDRIAVSGNQAINGQGGGIVNLNNLTVTNSTIGPDNTARSGGGLYGDLGTVVVDRSTIYSNTALYGAGMLNGTNSSLFLINSTISHNSASVDGGGVYNGGAANVYNTSILFNTADITATTSTAAGGILTNNYGTSNVRNMLLAGNTAAAGSGAADCGGILNTYANNVFGEASPCTLISMEAGSVTVLNDIALIDPLADNGGPTLTHALRLGSNAIDDGGAGPGCVDQYSIPLPTDQRGLPRVVGASCDVGAFEFLPPAAFLPLMRR